MKTSYGMNNGMRTSFVLACTLGAGVLAVLSCTSADPNQNRNETLQTMNMVSHLLIFYARRTPEFDPHDYSALYNQLVAGESIRPERRYREDAWGTAYQLTRRVLERREAIEYSIHSAGKDRRMGTADDLVVTVSVPCDRNTGGAEAPATTTAPDKVPGD
jgi:hypothetical protein